jgi:hypothetical protein
MALNPKFSNAAVNAAVDAMAALLNSGYLRIYDGSQPSTADTAVSTQTLLAELRFGASAFGAGSAGVAAAAAITQDTSANASGTATWYRALKSDGTSAVHDGSVGTSSANLVMNSVAISAGAAVQISAFSLTVSKG